MALPKFAALFALFWCVLLRPVVAQDSDTTWFWILADSVNSTAACPGRCLAVNDSSEGDYENKTVVFVACKAAASNSDGSPSPSDSANKNQQWLKGEGVEITIEFNATAATDGQTHAILCLQPDPAASNQTLHIAACTNRPNQKWIVANNSLGSLAFNPPRYLAMSYRLAGFLKTSDGPIGWRKATIFPSARPPNSSFTTTFSMVDASQDLRQPLAARGGESLNGNLFQNGGFEESSYDFPNDTTELTMSQSDPFSLCNWQVLKTEASLRGGPDPAASEGNRSLYLKDGIVKQNAATSIGAFYTLFFKVSVATATQANQSRTLDGTNQCNNNDTLSVNPYPSSDVHQEVQVQNRTWTMRYVSFQAIGEEVEVAFQGCTTCGCYLDDVNLVQVLGSAPFPPPPPRPSPPERPFVEEQHKEPPPFFPCDDGRCPHSDRLSNGAVVGIVVGAGALFFFIGAACVGVVGVKKKEERKESELMVRPREWSIQTTTPAQSQRGGGGSSSNAPDSSTTVPTPISASPLPLSSSNPSSAP